MIGPLTTSINPKWQHHILAAVMVTFILRMSFPAVRYVYYPLFILLLAYHLLTRETRKSLFQAMKPQLFYLVLLGIFIAAAFYHTSFMRPFIEAVNGIELVLLFGIIFVHVKEKNGFRHFSRDRKSVV